MATEQEKSVVLTAIRTKIKIAEKIGLEATARSWRELYLNVTAKPAAEIVMNRSAKP